MKPVPRNTTANALRLGVAAILCVVGILAAAVWTVSARLEKQVRQQIVDRDAFALHAVFTMQLMAKQESGNAPWASKDPLNQFTAILETSRLKGVLAARLYAPSGKFLAAIPTNVTSATLSTEALRSANQLSPLGQFQAHARLADFFEGEANTAVAPLVRVIVPIHSPSMRQLDGIAEFILDGHPVAAEYATLSRRLVRYAAVVFFLAAGVIALVVGWAVRRLGMVNRALAGRTAELVRANDELTLAAKTSAIGSVAAHLMHGLRNPLAGLQNFVSTRGGEGATSSDWELAVDAAERMRKLVDETVRVLSEEQGIVRYDVTSAELTELLRSRMTPLAHESNVHVEIESKVNFLLSNRDANIVLLILQNLLYNAIDCTPASRTVAVRFLAGNDGLVCEVRDEGTGLPEHVRENLFRPVRSTKPTGAGIGLAICKQLAAHIAADLTLKESSRNGTVFVLQLPPTPIA